MNGTRTETYEQAVERIMRAVRRGDMTCAQAAEAWREARKLPSAADAVRVEYEWRKQHAKGVRR